MHGSIYLESTPNVGSKAIFTIPMKVSSLYRNSPSYSSPPPHPGFRHYLTPNRTLPERPVNPVNHRIINQQITNSGTSHSLPPSHHLSRESIDKVSLSTLTLQQKKQTHVLLVEDKSVSSIFANYKHWGLTCIKCGQSNNCLKNHPQTWLFHNSSLEWPRGPIISTLAFAYQAPSFNHPYGRTDASDGWLV